MKPIPTDTEGITLAYGEHISHDPAEHVSFGRNPLAAASWAYVDSPARRVIYFPTQPSVDPRVCGGKVKAAQKAYEAMYGKLGTGATVVMVRDGVVTSAQYASQKACYTWDWARNRQVVTRGGRRYNAQGKHLSRA